MLHTLTNNNFLFYQKILVHELTLRRPAYELKKLNQTHVSSAVDPNPHRIDAALFAFNCQLSRGAILCNEVSLGKTIEAGLIISQLWAKGKRKIIIVVPAPLRKQWQNELSMNYYSLNRIKCCFLITMLYNKYNMKGEGKMKNRKSFGEFFKTCRIAIKETLRQFCIENGLDPGNISKLERSLLPPPQSREKLEEYARYLKIKKGSDDWYTFFDLAAAETGKIPEDIMTKEKIEDKLPILFRTLRGQKVSDDKLEELIKILKDA